MSNPKSKIQNPKSADARIAVIIGASALLLTCVPYLIGYFAAGKNHFLWLGGNIDDAAVYLSWMRQGESGSLRQFNRFTTDAQSGLFANPLFLLLGLCARVAHLPLVAVYHIARLGFGAALLVSVWKFIALVIPTAQPEAEDAAIASTTPDTRHPTPAPRLLAFAFVCFASGLGWLPIVWENLAARATCPAGPIDLWQPEAITFLSLYLNPLFLCGMLLQVLIFTLLLKAERGGGIKSAVSAGICGLILALVHSYDILTIAAIWFVYLIVRATPRSRVPVHHSSFIIHHSLIAAVITAPGVLLIASQLRTNKVFSARANVETLSAYPHWIALGYGLTLALAVYAAVMQSKLQNLKSKIAEIPFLLIWAIVNIAVAYIPGVAFQRKLLQGAHFPIAILAGVGAALFIAKRPPIQNPKSKIQDSTRFIIAAVLLTVLLSMTNLKFLSDETDRFSHNETKIGIARAALLPGEVEALQWIEANTPASAAVQPLPWETLLDNPKTGGKIRAIYDMTLPLFTPALANRPVYCGHFGETPDYAMRFTSELGIVALGITPESKRLSLLRRMNVSYLIFSQKDPADAAADVLFPQFRNHAPLPPYLTLVHSNAAADVYALRLP